MYKLIKSNGTKSNHKNLNDAFWECDLGSKIYLGNKLIKNIY